MVSDAGSLCSEGPRGSEAGSARPARLTHASAEAPQLVSVCEAPGTSEHSEPQATCETAGVCASLHDGAAGYEQATG